jgi:hypothetical protein
LINQVFLLSEQLPERYNRIIQISSISLTDVLPMLLPNLSMLKLKRLEDYSEGSQIKLFSYSGLLNYMRDFLNPSSFFGDPFFLIQAC